MVTAERELITTYLEMTNPNQLNGSLRHDSDVEIRQMQAADTHFYRYLYRAVGEKWRWRDRLSMSTKDLRAILTSDQTYVYVLYVSGAPAGYIELSKEGRSVEVAYFGLREEYHGRGLGKYLLTYGVDKAWKLGANKVWLHTCNLDGPHALANYQKRGFKVTMRHIEPMPATYL